MNKYPKLEKNIPSDIIDFVVTKYATSNSLPQNSSPYSLSIVSNMSFEDWLKETFFKEYIKNDVFDKESWLKDNKDYIAK